MIETERLILSIPTIDDFESFHAMLAESDVYRFLGNAPCPRPESWTKMLRSIGHWKAFDYGIFSVREKATGLYIGETGIGHFQRDLGAGFDPYPEAAWVFAAAGQGKGYATEAADAAHRWFVGLKGEQRTVCIIDPENAPSIRLAEKRGYRAFATHAYRGQTVTAFERFPAAPPVVATRSV